MSRSIKKGPYVAESLMKKIMNGYKRYIIGNGILNLDKIGFSSYMESDQFKQLLSESMGDLLDTTGLQEQFTASLQIGRASCRERVSSPV